MSERASEPLEDPVTRRPLAVSGSRCLPGGHVLLRAGEPALNVYLLRRGQARTYVLSGDGRETTTAILGAGQLLGLSPLLGRPTYHEFAETLGPVEVWVLPADRLLRELPANRDLLGLVVGALAKRLAQSVTLLADVALGSVTDRIVDVERMLTLQLGEAPRLNKRSFSELIGARPETLSRVNHQRPSAVVPQLADWPAARSHGARARLVASRRKAGPGLLGEVAAVLDPTAALTYAPGERIPVEKPGDGLYVMKDGSVRLWLEDTRGRQIVVDQIDSGCFGLADVAAAHRVGLLAEAMTPVSVWRLAPNDMLRLFDDHPRVCCRVVTETAERLVRVEQLLHRAHLRTARARVASLLLELTRREGCARPRGSCYVPSGWTHEALAHAVGARRETVTRALRDLAADGHVRREGQRLIVCDTARLARDLGLEAL